MNRIAYFGTPGDGYIGHHFAAISGEFSREEGEYIEKLDGDDIQKIFKGKRNFCFFKYGNYIGLAFPASPDDKRGGSVTIALVENATDEGDVLKVIEDFPFLKRQFNRLCELYDVQMPKM